MQHLAEDSDKKKKKKNMQDPKEVARFVFVLISVLDNLGSILPQVGAIMLV